MRKLFLPIMAAVLSAGLLFSAEVDAPWWKQDKIRFMWG